MTKKLWFDNIREVFIVESTGELFLYYTTTQIIERGRGEPYYKNRVDINMLIRHGVISSLGYLGADND